MTIHLGVSEPMDEFKFLISQVDAAMKIKIQNECQFNEEAEIPNSSQNTQKMNFNASIEQRKTSMIIFGNKYVIKQYKTTNMQYQGSQFIRNLLGFYKSKESTYKEA